MNFKSIEKSDKLLDVAFSRARIKSKQYPKQKTFFYTLKGKEIIKIDESSEYLVNIFHERVKDFPSVKTLPLFYQDLFEFILDLDKMKIVLSKFSKSEKKIKDLRRETIIALKELAFESNSKEKVKKISNKYFGRVSSIVNSLKKDIDFYNSSIKKLKELPSIKTDEELYLLSGLPNVGKSTLLKKITCAKPKIASFPFTTKGLNVGTFFKRHKPIQVIDTPGLLDRELEKRNKIELKAISAFQHLEGTIIFVVDVTQGLDKQKNLLEELKKLFSEKGFIVVLNKSDLIKENELKGIEKEFSDFYLVIEGNDLDNLKKELNDN